MVTGNHNSFAVRSLTLPNTGIGFGPGGNAAVGEALLAFFRNQTKRATRRAVSPTKPEVLITIKDRAESGKGGKRSEKGSDKAKSFS